MQNEIAEKFRTRQKMVRGMIALVKKSAGGQMASGAVFCGCCTMQLEKRALQKLRAFPRKKWMLALMIIMDFIMMLDLCGDQPQQLTMI